MQKHLIHIMYMLFIWLLIINHILYFSYTKKRRIFMTLSLCMIVKNEEETLERCLISTKNLFDEIIIVDTGSTDKTKEIIKNYTDKIYDFKWCDDFSKARNFSFSKATKDYIIWLDADDVILEDDLKKLYLLKERSSNDTNIFMLKYNLNLDSNGIPALSYYRERIIKNKMFKWISPIHEVIVPSGNIKYEDIAITHKKINPSDPKRNLNIFENMIKKNIKFDTRQTFYYARELYYNNYYEKSIYYFNIFLKKDDAWIENKISACIDLFYIYNKKNDIKKALSILFRTFEFSKPRAEICCHIGEIFFKKTNYNIASFWYNTALNDTYDIKSGGFYNKDYYDFIPYIQLCVCYYYMNDIKKAILFNEKAGKLKPENISYKSNKIFFENTYIKNK